MKYIKAISIKYIYKDGPVNIKDIPDKVKKYYEDNSRGNLTIYMKTISMNVPYNSSEYKEAIKYVKEKTPPEYDIYIHFCNPKTSQTGGKIVLTWASSTNAIHEFGHALGFAHANSLLSGKKEGSKDPFDQMTIYSPYPSTNAPHRYQMRWFLPGELLECGSGIYTIGSLKNFKDVTSVKVLKMGRYFISYGNKKEINYVTIHTIYDKKFTFIIGMYKAEIGKTYTNELSGLVINIKKTNDILTTIEVKCNDLEDEEVLCSSGEICEDSDIE